MMVVAEKEMTSDRKQILEMLSEGKVTVEEAERLIQAGEKSQASSTSDLRTTNVKPVDPRFIRIVVEPIDNPAPGSDVHHVNIRIPLKIIRAGVNLATLIPGDAGKMVQTSLKDKGYHDDISKLSSSALDDLIEALQELSIDATADNHSIKVFVE